MTQQPSVNRQRLATMAEGLARQRLLPAGWPGFLGEEAPEIQGASVTVSDQMPTKATSGRFDTEP